MAKDKRAFVIFKDRGRFLLVQEVAEAFKGQWGLPGGHLDGQETFIEGARREVKEEVNLVVQDLQILHEFFHPTKDQQIIVFSGEATLGELKVDKREILDAKWLTLDQINKLDEQDKLRAVWVIDSVNKAASL